MTYETKIKDMEEDLEELFANFIGKPEWYRKLPEEDKSIVKPVLDELVKVISDYFYLRPSSKRKALSYIKEGYSKLEEKINDVQNLELKNILEDYCKELISVLLE
ncbi:MAG: hypothetical protein QW228_10025 [Candidatus Aenigmatarchaeota archaeon]